MDKINHMNRIQAWQQSELTGHTLVGSYLKMEEELGEFGVTLEVGAPDPMELVDVYFLMCQTLLHLGITGDDFERMIEKKFKVNRDRVWAESETTPGAFQHVEKS